MSSTSTTDEAGIYSHPSDDDFGARRATHASPSSLSELLNHFVETTRGQDKVQIADLLDSLNTRSHGPMLLFPSVIAISPLGMIPGMSIVTGTLVILIAAQMIFFSERPWVPKRIASFQFSRDNLKQNVQKWQKWIDWFERFIHQRMQFFTRGVMMYPVAIACIGLALLFYPLSLVPFGVVVPGLAIALFALGLTARDGLLVLSGFVTSATSVFLVWKLWPF